MARNETIRPSGMENPKDWKANTPELGDDESPEQVTSKRDSGIWKKGENTYEVLNEVPGNNELVSPEEEARLEMKRAERAQAIKDEAAMAQARMETKMDASGPGTMEVNALMDQAIGMSEETMRAKEREEIQKDMERRAMALPEEIEITDDMLEVVETGAHVDPEAAKARLVVAEARLAELNGAGGVDALEKSLKDKYGYDADNVVGRSGILGGFKAGFKALFKGAGFSAMKKTYEMRLAERNTLQEQISMDKAIVANPEGFAAQSKHKGSIKRMSRPSPGSNSGPMGVGRGGPK